MLKVAVAFAVGLTLGFCVSVHAQIQSWQSVADLSSKWDQRQNPLNQGFVIGYIEGVSDTMDKVTDEESMKRADLKPVLKAVDQCLQKGSAGLSANEFATRVMSVLHASQNTGNNAASVMLALACKL